MVNGLMKNYIDHKAKVKLLLNNGFRIKLIRNKKKIVKIFCKNKIRFTYEMIGDLKTLELVNRQIWLANHDYRFIKGEKIYVSPVIGFKMIDVLNEEVNIQEIYQEYLDELKLNLH